MKGETARGALLSFLAGYVDTCVFVALFGLFTAHVTGNFVLIGAALVHHGSGIAAKLLAFPAFVVAVALAVKVDEALERRKRRRLPPLLYAQALLLIGTWLTVPQVPDDPDDLRVIGAGMLAAAAMGLQNALMRLELASMSSTTVMTINVTQGAIDVVTMLGRRVDPATDDARRTEARTRFARMWPQIVAFTAGAIGGALGYALVGLAALVLPALLCLVLALRWPAPPGRS